MTDCVLLAELGANPAALVEALWTLVRLRGMRVRGVFVLTSTRGAGYLEAEVLRPGAVYDDLRRCLGDAIPARDALHVVVAPSPDEFSPDASTAWNEARWRNALTALRAAREADAVAVFALAGGRQRTSAALSTVMFQLLARPRDLLVDVRVGDRRVEGARAGFYFPEQSAQSLTVENGPLLARDVAVHLVEVKVPRLRRLLAGRQLDTWADALAAGQVSLDDLPRVKLQLHVSRGTVHLNDRPVKFPQAEFVWFAAVVLARLRSEEGWLRSDDAVTTRAVLVRMREAQGASWSPSAEGWKNILEKGALDPDEHPNLSKVRSSAAKRFAKALAALRLPATVQRGAALQQDTRYVDGAKATFWRLPLDPDDITLRDDPPPA
jgi:CRISPR-associated protein (TIGR02584 family)